MRSRLIRSALMVVVLAVVTLGGPLLVVARHQVFSSANERLKDQATSVAADLEDDLSAGKTPDLSVIRGLQPDEQVIVTTKSGTRLTAGTTLHEPSRSRSVTIAGSTVTVEVPAAPTNAKARNFTLLILGLAALAALIAVALAIRQARHLAAPLAGLAERADALGVGDFSPSGTASGIAEIDAIAQVLDRSAAQLDSLITLQRELATDAAHQLRTPLTGIGLRLEEITRIGDADTRSEAESALAQVERLNQVISSLMARARGDSQEPTTFDVGLVVRDEAQVWKRVLHQHRRELIVDAKSGAAVRARREHVTGILTSLLDNALVHGAGDVTVRVQADADDVVLSVRDSGPGIPADLRSEVFKRSVSGSHGTGIGLALARSLALGEGGSLEISAASPAELALRLPRSRPDGQ